MPKNLTIHKLFLVDAVGATVTALMLGLVLPRFEEHIGMPRSVLLPLAIAASLLAVYSFACFRWVRQDARLFLRAIAIANGLYCLVTSCLILVFWHTLTPLGIAYFLGEIAIIAGLVRIEWRLASAGDPPIDNTSAVPSA